MMTGVVVLAAVLGGPSPAFQDPPKAVPAAEAARFVGQRVELEGLVAGVRVASRGSVILDLDAKYPAATLSVVVPSALVPQCKDVKKWGGKRIVVRGVVQRGAGKLQITLEAATDLALAGAPARLPC